MNWIQSAVMGFFSGFCELLPMSAEAHRGMLRYLMGIEPEGTLFLLLGRIAVLTVLLCSGRLELRRLHRTAKLLNTPTRRRTGRPERNSAGTLRMIRIAAIPAVAGRLLSIRLTFLAEELWMPVIPLLLGGLILWLPSHFRTANKDGRHMTTADGFLMGLGFLLGAVPGLSPVGIAVAAASLLGASRTYALWFVWILAAISLATGIFMDGMTLFISGFVFDSAQLLSACLGAAFAALGAYFAIHFAQSRIRPGTSGLGEFCYYNWGQALLCAALFLLV